VVWVLKMAVQILRPKPEYLAEKRKEVRCASVSLPDDTPTLPPMYV
jgi:hypothetical protein